MIEAVAFALIGAVLNRHRGGWLPTGHTEVARADYAIGFALLAMLAAWDWRLAALAPIMWLGSLAGNAAWFHVTSILDVIKGSGSGVLNVIGACAVIAIFAHWWLAAPLLVAGMCKGPLYWLSWRIPSKVPALATGPEIGEALFGAALGAAIAFV